MYICLFDYSDELPGIRTPVPLVRWHVCYHCTMLTDTSIKVWPLLFCIIVPLDQESMCYHRKGMSSNPPPAANYVPLWAGRHGVMAIALLALDIPLHSIHLSIWHLYKAHTIGRNIYSRHKAVSIFLWLIYQLIIIDLLNVGVVGVMW